MLAVDTYMRRSMNCYEDRVLYHDPYDEPYFEMEQDEVTFLDAEDDEQE